MSILQEEVTNIENQIDLIPETVVSDRINLARKSGLLVELLNKPGSLSGLQDGYYDLIKKYARERAYYIENSENRLDFYNINSANVWNTVWENDFTYPSIDEFIVYCFLDNGTRVNLSDGYNLIINNQTLVGYYQAITILPDDQVIPDYMIETVTVSGIDHEKVILADSVNQSISIGNEFALIENGSLVGVARVGIEGLGLSDSWSATDPSVDPYSQSSIDNWYTNITDLPVSDFIAIGGDFLVGSVPIDDVLKSSDPSIQSDVSEPYTQAKLEASPFYPALNTDDSSWPEDFDAPDVKNRKQTLDGDDLWAVYPQFRWEGKLIPDLSEDPTVEFRPNTDFIIETIDFILGIFLSNEDFPINSGTSSDGFRYFWDMDTDLVMGRQTISGIQEPLFEVDCTYNSVTNKLSHWDNVIQTLLNTVKTLITEDVNTVDSIQNNNDLNHLSYINLLEGLVQDVRNHHETWFEPNDDGDISKFDTDFGTYDQTDIQNLETELDTNSKSVFSDRINEIESVIGTVSNRSGYVGKVLTSVDALVNRNFGFISALKKSEANLENSKEILQRLRKKYDVYAAGL
jgi:hypothetical protein